MCGIAGFVGLGGLDPGELEQHVLGALEHRGPDDSGSVFGDDYWLGMRRLAIIDLSPAGAQPMERDDGRLRIVFNGEIYNHRELRRELESRGAAFRSRSDTEVILALYAEEGPRMLERLRGMYALALWDAADRSLLLAG